MPEALSDSVNGTNTGVLTFLHSKQRDIADHVIILMFHSHSLAKLPPPPPHAPSPPQKNTVF